MVKKCCLNAKVIGNLGDSWLIKKSELKYHFLAFRHIALSSLFKFIMAHEWRFTCDNEWLCKMVERWKPLFLLNDGLWDVICIRLPIDSWLLTCWLLHTWCWSNVHRLSMSFSRLILSCSGSLLLHASGGLLYFSSIYSSLMLRSHQMWIELFMRRDYI